VHIVHSNVVLESWPLEYPYIYTNTKEASTLS
jgi:hypothetical protein